MSAPWALGFGMLVSFTAEAGNAPQQSGISSLAREHMAALSAGTAPFLPSELRLRPYSGNTLLDKKDSVVQAVARFMISPAEQDETGEDFVAPRADLKDNASTFPQVNRAAKGAPRQAVAESLSRRAIDVFNASTAKRLAFARDERVLPPTLMMPGGGVVNPDDWQTLHLSDDEDVSTSLVLATATQSPLAAAAGSTGSGITVGMGDGSTPGVSRAVVLSSITPAPFDERPAEISGAAPVTLFGIPAWSDDVTQPNYAALINNTNLESEKRCLAEAVYFEARSETPEGQAAVAQVVLNRVRSGLYPTTICGVVYQNRNRHLACQFTFACEGKALHTNEPGPWAQAQRVADEVLEGKTYLAEVGGATHYHADYVRPYWAKKLRRMDVIGRHIFYKLKPGQT